MAKWINIIENFKILFEIMNLDTKIDEQSKSNVKSSYEIHQRTF